MHVFVSVELYIFKIQMTKDLFLRVYQHQAAVSA